jgi:hypothetical protein
VRLNLLEPPLDPVGPIRVACSPSRALAIARTEPPRPPPPAIAMCPLRQLLRPNSGHPQALGEHVVVPHRFPDRERSRLTGIRSAPPLPMAEGHIASPHFIPVASPQSYIFNSILHLLKLVKCVEIRRKFRKMQTQFCWICCAKYYNFCYTHIA